MQLLWHTSLKIKEKAKLNFVSLILQKKKKDLIIKIYTFSQVPREVTYTGNSESTRYRCFITYIFADSTDFQFSLLCTTLEKTFHPAEFIYQQVADNLPFIYCFWATLH